MANIISESIANYYELGRKLFLIMGDEDPVRVYNRPGSPWKRLNGEPYQIANLEEALGKILADPNTRNQITPPPNNLHPLYAGAIDGGERLVMISLKDWNKFHRYAQQYF